MLRREKPKALSSDDQNEESLEAGADPSNSFSILFQNVSNDVGVGVDVAADEAAVALPVDDICAADFVEVAVALAD